MLASWARASGAVSKLPVINVIQTFMHCPRMVETPSLGIDRDGDSNALDERRLGEPSSCPVINSRKTSAL